MHIIFFHKNNSIKQNTNKQAHTRREWELLCRKLHIPLLTHSSYVSHSSLCFIFTMTTSWCNWSHWLLIFSLYCPHLHHKTTQTMISTLNYMHTDRGSVNVPLVKSVTCLDACMFPIYNRSNLCTYQYPFSIFRLPVVYKPCVLVCLANNDSGF